MAGFRRVLIVGASFALLASPGAVRRARRSPWDAFNLSPSAARTQLPRTIAEPGAVTHLDAVLSCGATTLGGGGRVTLDFGQEVGGTVTVRATGQGRLGMAFAESSAYIDITSDATTGGSRNRDGAITVDVSGATDYTTPLPLQRGGFRYLTLFPGVGYVGGRRRRLGALTAAPTMADLERVRELLLLERRSCSTASGTRAPTPSRRTRSTRRRAARGPRRTRSGATRASRASARRPCSSTAPSATAPSGRATSASPSRPRTSRPVTPSPRATRCRRCTTSRRARVRCRTRGRR